MDAAVAAAMSDPERNPHFRRRWDEGVPHILRSSAKSSTPAIGTLGLVLQEALSRASRSSAAARPIQSPECPIDG